MRAIVAIIQPHKLSDVVLALHKVKGLSGMTVADVKGFGRSRGKNAEDLVSEELGEFKEKIKIEIYCPDELVDDVVNAILENAHTGLRGDGKIYVMEVENAVRISTGETGEIAV